MGRHVSDYSILVPETPEPGACLEEISCLKISAAPETPRGTKEQFWCWNTKTRRWEIYSEGEPPPPTQTITFQGAEDVMEAQNVIRELFQIGCPWPAQAVVRCGDEFDLVRTFPGISLNTWTPDNGYGYGVPGVDTATPPPSTITADGTWWGNSVDARILKNGPIELVQNDPALTGAILNDLFFCDTPGCGANVCGDGTPSNGCRTAYAIYDNGTNPIIATYHITFDRNASLTNTEVFSTSNGIVDATCLDGELIVTDGTCVYTKCGNLGLTKVTLPDDIPAGSIKGLAAAKGDTNHMYVLFGVSGVAHSSNGRTWNIALVDGFFPSAPQQTVIEAVGNVVVTGGADSSLLISTTGGSNWEEEVIDATNPTDDVLGIGLDLSNPVNNNYAYIYPLMLSASTMVVYFSGDNGETFEARSTFATTPQIPETARIDASAGGVYVMVAWDSTFQVNTNHACDCYWTDLSPDFACVSACMAVCPWESNTVLIISDGICDIFGRNDVAETPNATLVNINVAQNDRAAPGETLNLGSIAVGVLPAGITSAVPDGLGGIDVTPASPAGDDGVHTFTYTIDDTGANTSSNITVTVIVGDPDPTLLVC